MKKLLMFLVAVGAAYISGTVVNNMLTGKFGISHADPLGIMDEVSTSLAELGLKPAFKETLAPTGSTREVRLAYYTSNDSLKDELNRLENSLIIVRDKDDGKILRVAARFKNPRVAEAEFCSLLWDDISGDEPTRKSQTFKKPGYSLIWEEADGTHDVLFAHVGASNKYKLATIARDGFDEDRRASVDMEVTRSTLQNITGLCGVDRNATIGTLKMVGQTARKFGLSSRRRDQNRYEFYDPDDQSEKLYVKYAKGGNLQSLTGEFKQTATHKYASPVATFIIQYWQQSGGDSKIQRANPARTKEGNLTISEFTSGSKKGRAFLRKGKIVMSITDFGR